MYFVNPEIDSQKATITTSNNNGKMNNNNYLPMLTNWLLKAKELRKGRFGDEMQVFWRQSQS